MTEVDFQWKKLDAIPAPQLPGIFAARGEVAAVAAADAAAAPDGAAVEQNGYDEGFQRGHSEGLAAAAAEQKKLLESLAAKVAEADQRLHDITRQAATLSAEMMGNLFSALFRYELTSSGALLAGILPQVLSEVMPDYAEGESQVRLQLSTRDHARLSEHLTPGELAGVRLLADESLGAGALRIVCGEALVHLDIADNVFELLLQAAADTPAEAPGADPAE